MGLQEIFPILAEHSSCPKLLFCHSVNKTLEEKTDTTEVYWRISKSNEFLFLANKCRQKVLELKNFHRRVLLTEILHFLRYVVKVFFHFLHNFYE